MKEFSLGAVLSVSTSLLLCDWDELYGILNYMTDDNLFTHQLPRARRACGPAILEQHPQLKEVEVPEGLNKDNYKAWLEEQAEKFGETLEVEPLKNWMRIDPLYEAQGEWGEDKVKVVRVGE